VVEFGVHVALGLQSVAAQWSDADVFADVPLETTLADAEVD